MEENFMNTQPNSHQEITKSQATITCRLHQAIAAANLKAATESTSAVMLNKEFSTKINGFFDIEYENEIKLSPKGLINFVASPVITFTPYDVENHKHLFEDGSSNENIDLSYVRELNKNSNEELHKTELENCVDEIMNFVEDEIQPEIRKYIHQAKRKNDFTKSVKKNGGKNPEKAMEVMKSAITILNEKFKHQS